VTAPGDRRARRKARTRVEIRTAAQQLFAERGFDAVTIADVAAAADVAVQTVFNHFASKEELFFADRTPWVDGPAAAVRDRAPGVTPMAALRGYTAAALSGLSRTSATPERCALLATLEGSAALQAHLPVVDRQSERRLAAALAEAWRPPGADDDVDRELRMAAALTAGLWMGAARALVQELAAARDDGPEATAVRASVESLAARAFDRLETGLPTLLSVRQG
jgi:AcrR family transcriptional regulator